ncbi:MAG: Holliday junction branch migration protein RuvA [Gammaproteobacteria bacterium]|nr:Holliday junction branch migration protein RuvA [Gammaproteobacteria bacterium]
MIGHLRGKLVFKQPPLLVLDVNGVGYELEAPMTTFYDLPEIDREVSLHTHLVVREDAQLLYGFSRNAHRQLFRSLLRVSGIGPRVGLAILSGISIEDFQASVASGNAEYLTRIPGVGNKTAQRLVVELRDKMQGMEEDFAPGQRATATTAARPNPVEDAVSALIALGYKPAEASRAVRTVDNDDMTSEQIIREALRSMSGSAA